MKGYAAVLPKCSKNRRVVQGLSTARIVAHAGVGAKAVAGCYHLQHVRGQSDVKKNSNQNDYTIHPCGGKTDCKYRAQEKGLQLWLISALLK